jgi:hypothetical protein
LRAVERLFVDVLGDYAAGWSDSGAPDWKPNTLARADVDYRIALFQMDGINDALPPLRYVHRGWSLLSVLASDAD